MAKEVHGAPQAAFRSLEIAWATGIRVRSISSCDSEREMGASESELTDHG
jgi:hypothetical protein